MNVAEIYNMKVNMGLLDLQKYKGLIDDIENIPDKYINAFELEKIANDIKEELKLDNSMDLDEIVDLYSDIVFNLHSKLGNTLSELEFKFNQVKIQARLKALKNPGQGSFNLNGKIDYNDLGEDVISLLNLACDFVKMMAQALEINILVVSDENSINKVKDNIKLIKSNIESL